MYSKEIEIRTTMVEIHREHLIKLLKTTQDILRKKEASQDKFEQNMLWGLFQQVAMEAEKEQKAMMDWAMEYIKVSPVPPLSELH
jgi:CRISPR-associated protein Cas8b1/Cst1 subtype I-B